MADNTQVVQRGGLGILGWLTIIFVIAKLLELGPVADWSWILVLSPLLIGAGFTILALLIVVALGIIAAMVD